MRTTAFFTVLSLALGLTMASPVGSKIYNWTPEQLQQIQARQQQQIKQQQLSKVRSVLSKSPVDFSQLIKATVGAVSNIHNSLAKARAAIEPVLKEQGGAICDKIKAILITSHAQAKQIVVSSTNNAFSYLAAGGPHEGVLHLLKSSGDVLKPLVKHTVDSIAKVIQDGAPAALPKAKPILENLLQELKAAIQPVCDIVSAAIAAKA